MLKKPLTHAELQCTPPTSHAVVSGVIYCAVCYCVTAFVTTLHGNPMQRGFEAFGVE
jgi:hypothetical protein